MVAKVSYSAFDVLPIEPVPAIAAFDNKGKVKPLYIQFHNVRLKVESFYVVSESRISIDFNCIVSDSKKETPLYITYYKNEGLWAVDQDSQFVT